MYANDSSLYPMLGVGAFVPMFWLGVVLGYEAGLNCLLLLLSGLAFGCLATWLVVQLEASEPGRRGSARRRAPRERPSAPFIAPIFSRAD